ncbi:MAG TPA: HDIG domain-containing protein [Clostridiaceae bacterium]|nr:HDIG domain-containing protein [Clostridiaceae bacterium]
MTREEAIREIRMRIKNVNLIKHSLAVAAIMKSLAARLGEAPERWELAGILHDIDYEKTGNDMSKHSLIGAEILENLGVDGEIVYAVKAHNSYHGIERRRRIDKALYCSDPVSGLITACALILPDKSLEKVTTEFVLKKFDEKSFARGADRNTIKTCDELDLSLEEFIDISLNAMKEIKDDLGL